MTSAYADILARIAASGNFRSVAETDSPDSLLDFSLNDYLGLAHDASLREEFLDTVPVEKMLFSASASRLLSSAQQAYASLEHLLSALYRGRKSLLFNSGYHANVGLVSSLSSIPGSVILADKLVHASIIDGVSLSGARMLRFRHNDMHHLERLAGSDEVKDASNIIIIAEAVYSMDGDPAPIEHLASVKQRIGEKCLLYIDEAHSFGCTGPCGLGLSIGSEVFDSVDLVIGTLGKAAASSGAFAVMPQVLRDFAVNRARSFIFSTAIPPVCAEWSKFVIMKMLGMDDRRTHLMELAARMESLLAGVTPSQPRYIYPYMCRSADRAVELSRKLLDEGIKVLPIRTPTVPPGTERLRISLSASMSFDDIERLAGALHTC